MKNLRNRIPWWVRLSSKLFLSRLPVSYSFWKRLNFFEHGKMNHPQFSMNIFLELGKTVGLFDLIHERQIINPNVQFSLLELGPGDSLFTAVIARCFNFKKSWLVDAGDYAKKDISIYRSLFNFLRQNGYRLFFDENINSIDEILEGCSSVYLTDGVKSLQMIPSSSIDYCFSNAVLEHIPKQDFRFMAHQLCRVLRPDGLIIHRVDLKDHLGGGLNHLRFPESIWEGNFFSKSGFYTNRIQYSRMIQIFTEAGFLCSIPRVLRWETLPIKREDMDIAFRNLPLDELLISGFDIILRKPEGGR